MAHSNSLSSLRPADCLALLLLIGTALAAAVTLPAFGDAPAPTISGYAATNPRGVAIFSAPPGAPLLIEGANLGSSGAVAFGGIPAPPPASWSATEILVTVPTAAAYPFTGPVTVTTNGQTANGPAFTITAPPPPPPPTSISSCPFTIRAPGAYVLQKDLSCARTAITVAASNVALDLGGHTLTGSGAGDGIYVNRQEDVSIDGGTIQGFVVGVDLEGTVRCKVTNVTASQNKDSGIAGLAGTIYLTVTGCTATQNSKNGIYIWQSNGNTVTHNTANGNFWGIAVVGAVANTVADNTTNQNRDRGITLYANDNVVERNTCDLNVGGGIDVAGDSHGNTVARNSCTANDNGGIRLYDQETRNTVQDNTVRGSYLGIFLARGATGNTIQGNAATLNQLGFRVDRGATGNTFQNNTAMNNANFDVWDDNPSAPACTNTWLQDTFQTAGGKGAPCIH